LLFSARSREGSVCPHEASQHRCDQLRRFDGLARLAAEDFRIGDQITMDGGRQLDGKPHRLVVRHGGELEFSMADILSLGTVRGGGRG